jgi:dimethylargininase
MCRLSKYISLIGVLFSLDIMACELCSSTKQEIYNEVCCYGSQSMIDPLLKVLVKRPDSVFAEADSLKWHYTSSPDLALAQVEHDEFVKRLTERGIDVYYHDELLPGLSDAIFVHDPAFITEKGAVILRMGKPLRRGEEEAMEKKLNSLGIPTLFKLTGEATAEAGDTLWIDENTLAIGRGFRTNQEGIDQIREGLSDLGIEVLPVDLPYWEGEQSCLHLQSLISLVDEKVALVYIPYLAVSFVNYLKMKGFKLIEVPTEEFLTMGSNVLALSPGVCLTIEGNPITKQRLEEANIEVITYRGNEISLKAEGGATCLTRPLRRRAD